jgi:hypothetical protein
LVGIDKVQTILLGTQTNQGFTIDLSGQTEDFEITGGTLNDTITGGAGNDTIDGGDGTDTVEYMGDVTISSIIDPVTMMSTGFKVDADLEGMDTLNGVEKVIAGAQTYLLVGNGGYATIQAAVEAAEGGEIIVVAAGNYAESVKVDVQVTIVGANAGLAGDDVGRMAESQLTGSISIMADGVTIDGLKFAEGNLDSTEFTTAYVAGDNVTITNSVFSRTGAVDTDGSRGIITATGSGSGLIVSNNTFSGFHTGTYLNPSNDLASVQTIEGNVYQDNAVGVSVDGVDNGVRIRDNDFIDNRFEQIGLGVFDQDEDLTAIVEQNNMFSNVDSAVPTVSIYPFGDAAMLQSIKGTVLADTFNGDQANTTEAQRFEGGAGNDTINLGGGDDVAVGGTGDDTINGGDGNDVITSGDGDDVVRGGLGADNIDTGSGNDIIVIVGTLTGDIAGEMDDAAKYENFNGSVTLTNGDVIDLKSVVTRTELINVKQFDDATGDTIILSAGDKIVVFGNVNFETVNNGDPIPSEFIVNSTVTFSYAQLVSGQTKITGAQIGGTQTPSKVIITDIPAGIVNLAIFDLAGIEEVTLSPVEGQTLENTQVIFSEEFAMGLDGIAPVVNVVVDGVEELADPNAGNIGGIEDAAVNEPNDNGGPLVGTAENDVLIGGAGADEVAALSGNDLILGSGGNDSIDGGADVDTAVYTSNVSFELVPDLLDPTLVKLVVNAGDQEGSDTLVNVERVDANGQTYLIVGNGGYANLQDAVDAAVGGEIILLTTDVSGAVVVNADALGSGSKGLTIKALGEGVDLTGSITVNGTLNGEFKVEGLNVDAAGQTYGVYVTAGSTDFGGTVTLNDVTVTGANSNGFAYILQGNGAGPVVSAATVGKINILNSEFTGNVLNHGTQGGGSEILIFGYNKDLTISQVAVQSATGPIDPMTGNSTAVAQKAIQLDGLRGALMDIGGAVVYEKITVSGDYKQDVIAIYTFEGFRVQPQFTDVVFNNVTSGFGDILFNLDDVQGVVDLSGVSASDLNIDTSFVGSIQGLKVGTSDDTFTGTAENDFLLGRSGADTLTGAQGNDVILGDSADMLISGGEGTDTLLVNADYVQADDAKLTGVEKVATTLIRNQPNQDFNIDLSGQSEGFEITGGSLNDTITGGAGNDLVNGAAGTDTVLYSGPVTITSSGSSFSVVSDMQGTDLLSGVEKVVVGTQTYLLVGHGGYAQIQDAVNAASTGDIILVAPGTYNPFEVSTNGITILSTNGAASTIIGNEDPNVGSLQGSIELNTGLSNVTIGAVNQGFTVLGMNGNGPVEKAAIYMVGSHSGHSFVGNTIIARGDAGLQNQSGPQLSNILIDRNIFTGTTFEGDQPQQDPNFDNQFMVGNNLPRQLVVLGNGGGDRASAAASNVTFTNNTVSGTAGGGIIGNMLVTIDAIDSVVAGNTFSGFTTGIGAALRMRRDGADVLNNTLDHSDTGNSAGFILQNQTGSATDFAGNKLIGKEGEIDSVTMTLGDDLILGFSGADSINGAAGTDLLSLAGTSNDLNVAADNQLVNVELVAVEAGGAAGVTIDLSNQTEGFGVFGSKFADTIKGGLGADRILGGDGNDNIDGSESADQSMDAVDTAVYLAQAGLDSTDFSFVDGAFTVSTVTGGVDTLVNIEKVESLAADGVTVASRFLLVGNGGYATLQDALAASSSGDTIVVANGVVTSGDLTISQSNITILGAQFKTLGSDTSRVSAADNSAESLLLGRVTITGNNVTLAGFKQDFDSSNQISPVLNGSAIFIQGANAVIENNIILRTDGTAGVAATPTTPAVTGDTVAAIRIQGVSADIEGNYIANPGALTNGFGGSQAGFNHGIYGDVAASGDAQLINNLIHNVRTAIGLDYATNSTLVLDNEVTASGTGVSIGVFSTVRDLNDNIVDNQFDLVLGGTTYNFQNVVDGDGITFASETAGNDGTLGGVAGQRFLGSNNASGSDDLTGTTGNDFIDGRAGADELTGGAGNDRFMFRNGESTVTTTDTVTDFLSGDDLLDFSVAATPANYLEATEALAMPGLENALVAANAAFAAAGNEGISFVFQFDVDSGYLFLDTDNNNFADQAVILIGVDNTEIKPEDIV